MRTTTRVKEDTALFCPREWELEPACERKSARHRGKWLERSHASKRTTASKSAAESGIELRREEQIGREHFCRVVPRRVVEVLTSKAHVCREAGTEAGQRVQSDLVAPLGELDASAAHGP